MAATASIWDVLTAFGGIGAAVAAVIAATAALRQAKASVVPGRCR